jgi:acetyl-CoA C-acetyltransferase
MLLGRSGPIARGRTIDAFFPAVPGGLPSSLLERRPDIRQAEENLIAANADIGVAKAAYFPDISLTGLLGLQSADLSDLFKGPSKVWSFGGSVLQPIFNAGRIESQVARAEALQREALYTYEKSIISAFQDVDNALIDRRKFAQVREEQAKNVEALQRFRDLAALRYREGATIYLEVATAEQSLFNAELAYVTIQSQLFQAYSNLYKAMGGGWVEGRSNSRAAARSSKGQDRSKGNHHDRVGGSPPRDLARGGCANAVHQNRRPARRVRRHRAVAPCRAPHGRPIARGRPGLCGLGHGRSQPDLEQHRARSADGRGRRCDHPAFSTVMACATSMIGAIEAAGMIDGVDRTLALVGGTESMSRVQLGLGQRLSDWVRKFQQARTLAERVSHFADLKLGDLKLYIPSITNRTTGKSMGEHTAITAKEWQIARTDQDRVALESHQRAVAAWDRGFFDDLVIPIGDLRRDTIPRQDTSLEKLSRLMPSFDRTSGGGTLTAGNSSPLTDGAAGVWVASREGLARLPPGVPAVRLIDWEIAAIDFRTEGLLMAPAFAIPRLLARNALTYSDIDLWEIHEAFAAQVLFHIKALESPDFLRGKVGVEAELGAFPRGRVNPNGGSVALGHPFGATGARILSQAVKELAARPTGERCIVSICTDGGQGSVALLQSQST